MTADEWLKGEDPPLKWISLQPAGMTPRESASEICTIFLLFQTLRLENDDLLDCTTAQVPAVYFSM